ncbi:DUF1007 family protein [Bordetella sp. N]|uniref:DUF1007 family protein n=1 Tax=Bordetella sp. N TaxID=1746199 RepID=UPI00070B6532|nr:DUF1007 family protein [Bordetella sp. N]ALM87168.1 hypothetical protein ASB57_21805 [Bordetella sp. N]
MPACAVAFCAAAAALVAAPASAHPHMWIDGQAQLVFDDQGRLAALRERWKFDEMFVAYTTQGLADKKGQLATSTLNRMAREWMSALGEPISHYFTRVAANGKVLPYGTPRDAKVEWDAKSKAMTLVFTLPLQQPVAPGAAGVDVDIIDPTYFVAYDFSAPGAISMDRAPANCRADYRAPKPLDAALVQQLAAIPADQPDLPEELFAITKGLTHRVRVTCE